jgi:hypothetical protein
LPTSTADFHAFVKLDQPLDDFGAEALRVYVAPPKTKLENLPDMEPDGWTLVGSALCVILDAVPSNVKIHGGVAYERALCVQDDTVVTWPYEDEDGVRCAC